MNYYIETIMCPECGTKQAAKVEHTFPFSCYGHICAQCKYCIMDSKWHSLKNRRDPQELFTPGALIEQLPAEEKILSLSWKQPFGSLMLHGKKETRVWDTLYRGYVLICASKQSYTGQQVRDIAGHHQFNRILQTIPDNSLITGQAIAIGKLVGSSPMTREDENSCFVRYRLPWIQETKRGPKEYRLWVHNYANVQAIEPFAWEGSQGWRALTWEDKKKVIIL